jgi:Uma2 family endonuclease
MEIAMSTRPIIRLTQAEFRHEFLAGEVLAMTRASRNHNLITVNVAAPLSEQLRRRQSEVYASDMRVKISPPRLYAYPDVIVVCGTPRFEDDVNDTLLNPTILIEVLSKSTEAYDRGLKSELYRGLESLQELILIAQSKRHLKHYRRQSGNRWILTETNDPAGSIVLESITTQLTVAQIYLKVALDLPTSAEYEGYFETVASLTASGFTSRCPGTLHQIDQGRPSPEDEQR